MSGQTILASRSMLMSRLPFKCFFLLLRSDNNKRLSCKIKTMIFLKHAPSQKFELFFGPFEFVCWYSRYVFVSLINSMKSRIEFCLNIIVKQCYKKENNK